MGPTGFDSEYFGVIFFTDEERDSKSVKDNNNIVSIAPGATNGTAMRIAA